MDSPLILSHLANDNVEIDIAMKTIEGTHQMNYLSPDNNMPLKRAITWPNEEDCRAAAALDSI